MGSFGGFGATQGSQATSISSAAFPLLAPNGTAAAPSYSFSAETTLGLYRAGAGNLVVGVGGDGCHSFQASAFITNALYLDYANADVRLVRDAAAVLALKNGTTAQEFRVYGTTTGSKYGSLKHNGTNALLTTTAGSILIGDASFPNVAFNAGLGAGTFGPEGKISVNTTAVGNTGSGEDDLQTYSLPLNSLSAAAKGVHITAWGTTANNANAKTIKLYFGSVAILTNALTASIAGTWRIEADVFSTGTDAQDAIAALSTLGAAGVALNDLEFTTLTQDDGAAIVIKTTGEAVDNNDILSQGLLVRFIS